MFLFFSSFFTWYHFQSCVELESFTHLLWHIPMHILPIIGTVLCWYLLCDSNIYSSVVDQLVLCNLIWKCLFKSVEISSVVLMCVWACMYVYVKRQIGFVTVELVCIMFSNEITKSNQRYKKCVELKWNQQTFTYYEQYLVTPFAL